MVLAIAQSAAWLFVLPIVCRPYWTQIFENLSQEMAEIVLGLVIPLIYFGSVLMILPIYYFQHPFFEQYKIQLSTSQSKPWPWVSGNPPEVQRAFWSLTRRSVKITLFNLFVLVPVLIVLKVRTVTALGLSHPSFLDGDWPTVTEMAWQNLALALLHEFGFYSMHRLMHTYPSLYKYHKVHHEYKHNTVLAAQHNHPVDHILSIGGPAVLATTLVRPMPHSFVIFQWFVWIVVANTDDHIGYSFPWSPVRWFPGAASTEEHEFHHSHNVGCFASKLVVFNKLFGGYEHYNSASNNYNKKS
jgi:sterol desaturase/sphingolipid hydroxylase (fatty acid hydroxylase superfamily)